MGLFYLATLYCSLRILDDISPCVEGETKNLPRRFVKSKGKCHPISQAAVERGEVEEAHHQFGAAAWRR